MSFVVLQLRSGKMVTLIVRYLESNAVLGWCRITGGFLSQIQPVVHRAELWCFRATRFCMKRILDMEASFQFRIRGFSVCVLEKSVLKSEQILEVQTVFKILLEFYFFVHVHELSVFVYAENYLKFWSTISDYTPACHVCEYTLLPQYSFRNWTKILECCLKLSDLQRKGIFPLFHQHFDAGFPLRHVGKTDYRLSFARIPRHHC